MIQTVHGQHRQFWSKHISSSRLSSAYFLFLLLLVFSSSVAFSSFVFLLLNLHLDLILFLRYFFLLFAPFFFHFLLLSFFVHLLLILIFSFPSFFSSSSFYYSLFPPFTSTSSVFSLLPPNSTSSHFPPLIISLPRSSSSSTSFYYRSVIFTCSPFRIFPFDLTPSSCMAPPPVLPHTNASPLFFSVFFPEFHFDGSSAMTSWHQNRQPAARISSIHWPLKTSQEPMQSAFQPQNQAKIFAGV